MQFSHSVSEVRLAPTMSGMNVFHLCGQSCLRICNPGRTPSDDEHSLSDVRRNV